MSLSHKSNSLTNFRAREVRENLIKEKGAEEIRRVFEKTEGCRWKKGTVPFCSECDLSQSYFVIKCAAS